MHIIWDASESNVSLGHPLLQRGKGYELSDVRRVKHVEDTLKDHLSERKGTNNAYPKEFMSWDDKCSQSMSTISSIATSGDEVDLRLRPRLLRAASKEGYSRPFSFFATDNDKIVESTISPRWPPIGTNRPPHRATGRGSTEAYRRVDLLVQRHFVQEVGGRLCAHGQSRWKCDCWTPRMSSERAKASLHPGGQGPALQSGTTRKSHTVQRASSATHVASAAIIQSARRQGSHLQEEKTTPHVLSYAEVVKTGRCS